MMTLLGGGVRGPVEAAAAGGVPWPLSALTVATRRLSGRPQVLCAGQGERDLQGRKRLLGKPGAFPGLGSGFPASVSLTDPWELGPRRDMVS